jgi:hypothetical protein
MLALLGLLFGLVGTGLGLWSVATRPDSSASSATTTPAAPTYPPDQVASAKKKVCDAHEIIKQGVGLNTSRPGPKGPDDALGWANVAHGRIANLMAGVYLPSRIEPATPPDLRDAVKNLADKYLYINALAVAGKTTGDPEFDAALKATNAASDEVDRQCQ